MAFPRIVPALADLRQRGAGPVPVALLDGWATGAQDLEAARTLLEPFARRGVIVSSDASGLSRLTREVELIDALQLISHPKQIVHAIGTAIGGRPVGRWVADNTRMFYPESVPLDLVVDAMAEVQRRIVVTARVQIGLCVHPGLFYEIGDAIYGSDARLVELLAEDHAGPGEVLLTGAAVAGLAEPEAYQLLLRGELGQYHDRGVFTLLAARHLPEVDARNVRYPHTYSEAFFETLLHQRDEPTPEFAKTEAYTSHLRERVILLAAREPVEASSDLAAMLDELLADAILDTIVADVCGAARVVKSGGGVAIATCQEAPEALALAVQLRQRLAENQLSVRIGIDRGPVLLFERPDGTRGVAGDPVNTASKIAEDVGQVGRISLTGRVAALVDLPPSAEPFEAAVSGVRLAGFRV